MKNILPNNICLNLNLLEHIIIDQRRNPVVILEAWQMTQEVQGHHQLQADLVSRVDPEEGIKKNDHKFDFY